MNRWTSHETSAGVEAVRRSPSVHDTQAWLLVFHDRIVSLRERFDVRLPRHDPMVGDRLISCGPH